MNITQTIRKRVKLIKIFKESNTSLQQIVNCNVVKARKNTSQTEKGPREHHQENHNK